MGQPAFGYEEYVGIGFEETAYNTLSDFTDTYANVVWMRVVENSLTIDDQPLPLPTMSGAPVERYCGTTGGTPSEYQGIPKFGGTVTVVVDPNALGPILWNALRIPHDSGYGVSGAGPYIHTFSTKVAPETIGAVPSLSLTRYNGQQLHSFTGVHINSLELSGSDDGPILLKIEPIPASYGTADPGGTPAFTTGPILRMHESRILYHATIGQTPASTFPGVKSWTYRIENHLRLDPTATVIASDGGTTPRRYHQEPIAGAYREFSLSMTMDWESNTWQALWKSVRAVAYWHALRLELNDDSAAANYSLTATHKAARLIGDFPTHGGDAGPVPQTLEWRAGVFNTGSADVIGDTVLTNDESEYLLVAP